ncbi:hypothetical protein [Flavobacterium coralii]|uniref:hypothetical protein n=1 Tax=Flavobacterium coralii TaxID=2838017 RepID=UPI000C550490|nr:hypothetical protein [Flavobacterium sp.]|tara:strand:+ start:19804 stop:20826 length:1023 start_codon:yes stop_codon:yes gene_type:complete
MIVSLIKNANYLYFSLHAEEVFTSNYIKDNNEGIYVSSLQFETIDRLAAFIRDFKSEKHKYIVLDFRHIKHIQANLISKIIEIREMGYKLIFKDVFHEIIDPLSLNVIPNSKNIFNQDGGYNLFYFFSAESDPIYSETFDEKILFNDTFEGLIINYITEYDKKHASSFVYLKSFIDLKKFISNERPFIYFALYKLAMKIKYKWKNEIAENPILVCQSLTSTFLVSILSKFLNLDILVFDKIGPITKLYNKLEKHNFDKRKYIIVSDLVCLGTEVKITKSLIEFSGGQYLGNVSLVKIETLTREDLQLDNIDRTISIFSITKENNKALNYYIYTNLQPIDE